MEINIAMKGEPEELREALTRMAGSWEHLPSTSLPASDLGPVLVWQCLIPLSNEDCKSSTPQAIPPRKQRVILHLDGLVGGHHRPAPSASHNDLTLHNFCTLNQVRQTRQLLRHRGTPAYIQAHCEEWRCRPASSGDLLASEWIWTRTSA